MIFRFPPSDFENAQLGALLTYSRYRQSWDQVGLPPAFINSVIGTQLVCGMSRQWRSRLTKPNSLRFGLYRERSPNPGLVQSGGDGPGRWWCPESLLRLLVVSSLGK